MKDAVFLSAPNIDDMDETSRKEYFDRLIDKITKDTMNPGMRKALLEKIAAYK